MKYKHLQSKFYSIITAILLLFSTSANAQIDYQIGNGTAQTAYSSACPLISYWQSTRQQYLFLASELTAAGMTPGIITAIKWDILFVNIAYINTSSTGYVMNYKIDMGTTAASAVTYGTPLVLSNVQTVVPRNSGQFFFNPGRITFTFPAPFVWNGTDNIVLDICSLDPGSNCCPNSGTSITNCTATSFNSCYYNWNSTPSDLCGVAGGSNSGTNNRPNTIFTAGQPCTGVPETRLILGYSDACYNRKFNLRLSGIAAFNLSYDWEYSKDGSTWNKFIGKLNVYTGEIEDSITETTYYRCKITCSTSGLTFMTSVFRVDVSPFYYCYCNTSLPTSNKGLDVGNVKITSLITGEAKLDNGVGTPLLLNDSANKTYSSFQRTLPPVVMYRDTTYAVQVTQINSTGTPVAGIAAVFIDYNRDGQFDTVKERVMNKAITNPSGLESDTFAVPFDAGIGLTGMRIVLRSDGSSEPCTGYSNGETEDYLVDLRYEPCKGPVNAGIIEGDSSLCTGYDYVVYDTTYERRKSEVGRMWQVSGDNINWQNAPSGGNKDSLMRVFTSQPLYYRLRTHCIPTKDTTFSPAHLVNAKAAYKCYCFSQAIGGYYKDSSDIGGISIGDYVNTDGGAHLKNPRATRKFQDHTDDTPIDINVDSMYSLTVFHTMKNDFHGDAKITIFMDFNNNHQYDIPDERVFTGYTNVNNHTVVYAINIPKTTIMNVPTGMRVILNNNVGPNIPSDEACGTYASGETENYMIKFVQGFPTSVNGHSGITNLSIYPNPTSGKFRLEYSGTRHVEEVEISVQDVTGRKLRNYREHNSSNQFGMDIDLSNEAKGVYFVEVKAGSDKRIERVTVK